MRAYMLANQSLLDYIQHVPLLPMQVRVYLENLQICHADV